MKTNEIFNEVRMAYMGQPLTSAEVKTLLSELPYGKTDLFLMALVANGCIEHPKKGQYVFTTHPVHHDLLDKAFNYVRSKANQYNKNCKKQTTKESDSEEKKIQDAIALLLSTGCYEIFQVEKVVTIKKTKL